MVNAIEDNLDSHTVCANGVKVKYSAGKFWVTESSARETNTNK